MIISNSPCQHCHYHLCIVSFHNHLLLKVHFQSEAESLSNLCVSLLAITHMGISSFPLNKSINIRYILVYLLIDEGLPERIPASRCRIW